MITTSLIRKNVLLLLVGMVVMIMIMTPRMYTPEKDKDVFQDIESISCDPMDKFQEDRSQFDPCLVNFVRKNYILPPPVDPSKNLTIAAPRESIRPVLNKLNHLFPKGHGFFIECGANDGEYNSNTIYLEQDFRWTGILIEPDVGAFEKLKLRKRNAYLANLCLSTTKTTKTVKWYVNPRLSMVNAMWDRKEFGATREELVDCVPLYSILKAINVSTIDYFSLDIEGVELEVLKTIPFDKIFIKVIQVEFRDVPGGTQALKEFLATKQFSYIGDIRDTSTWDSLFVHNDYMAAFGTLIN